MRPGARLISMHNSCAAPRFRRRGRFVLTSAQEAFLASSTLANSASTLSPAVLAIWPQPWNATGVPRHMFEDLRQGRQAGMKQTCPHGGLQLKLFLPRVHRSHQLRNGHSFPMLTGKFPDFFGVSSGPKTASIGS
jgi:hypothetical protein